ncbi:hypothetical protein [Clostridium sp. BL-8]|uniref:hypothetical protein n=1 Tax=Clostridium sp. BL-8 TaxID=349938 RepID=UPI00098CAF0C|nr:hypothetical protein [Clostridium sp. BL-8]OOM69832.1 hypothetical protein CLOBL_51440 [Clostridium sp. BL-8]
MKLKVFIIFFLMFTFALVKVPQAVFISDSYKQGVYNISEVADFTATAKLVVNPPTTLIIIDSTGNQRYFKNFENLNEVVNLGYIKNGDLIIIAGKGEIAITKS